MPLVPPTVRRCTAAAAAVALAVLLTGAAGAAPRPGEESRAATHLGAATVTAPPLAATGDGFLRVASPGRRVGRGPLRSYTVEVEDGVAVPPRTLAATVERTLADHRSWAGGTNVSLRRVAAGADFRILLARPATVDALCARAGLRTVGRYSCFNGDVVALNLDRWTGATDEWPDSIASYRTYVVNHEVGHALGHAHRGCPGYGATAPVMQQQTIGLDGCRPNPWPFPQAGGRARAAPTLPPVAVPRGVLACPGTACRQESTVGERGDRRGRRRAQRRGVADGNRAVRAS